MKRAMAYLWQLEFARNLSRQAGSTMTVRALRIKAARRPNARMPGNDRAKQFNLTLARSLRAAVTWLERDLGLSSSEAVRIAGAAFCESGTWLARGAIRLWLRLERDPFAGVLKRGPSTVARAMWGTGMVVEDRRT